MRGRMAFNRSIPQINLNASVEVFFTEQITECQSNHHNLPPSDPYCGYGGLRGPHTVRRICAGSPVLAEPPDRITYHLLGLVVRFTEE